MKSIFACGFLSLGLLAVGCGATKVSVDDINGLNPDVKAAIFTSVVQPADIDFDGVDDVDITTLTFVASDQDDLCGALTADPDALDNLPDLQAVQVAAFQIAALGQGADFAEGTIQGNKGLLDLVFNGAVGDTAVTGAVTIRQGGVDKVLAIDDSLFAVGDAVLELKAFKAGDTASADFTTTLTAETADAAFFDTDSDNDGTNDLQTLSNVLEASFKDATFCAAVQ